MSEQMREIAAQCWCDERTKHIVMEPALAEVFAEKLDALQRRVEELEGKLQEREKCSAYVMRDCPTHGESAQRNALTTRLTACQEALIEAKTEIEYMCESELASDKPYGWKRVVVAIDKALAQEGP